MLKLLLISIFLLAIAMSGMAFNIIFRKKGKFPSYRVGHNKNMKKLGITCLKHEELRCYGKQGNSSCGSCSE